TLGPVAGDGKAWQVVKAGVVPVYRKHYVTLSEVEYEKESVKAVLAVASSGQLYFSYDYDLTRTVQKNSSLDWAHPLANLARRLAPDPEHTEISGKASEGRSKHQAVVEDDADERFLPGRRSRAKEKGELADGVLSDLRGALPDFCVGCIFGHVSSTVVRTRELRSCTVSLIMRVNRRRAGTRFIKRGIDSQGNAACGVQTEMSAHNGESICAHVQARGSPPVMWDQIPTGFMASPPIRIHHTRRRSSFNPSSVSEINLG
ncbi:MAG: SAC domain-containing protein, partial [Olpidium bornovanus]